MRVMPILLCLLLAAGCTSERARGPNADVQEVFSPSRGPGGNLRLIAATVVEGGGHRGTAKDPPSVVIDLSPEFAGGAPPGRQTAIWTVLAKSSWDEQWEFETPMNGTRIIAFAIDSPGGLKVLADHVYADTEANRAIASGDRSLRRGSSTPEWLQLTFFVASLALAFAAAFLAWFRVKYGVIALAVSIAFWLGYEVTIPSHVNIRVDLLVLFPFLLAALFSVSAAVAYEAKSRRKGKSGDKESVDALREPGGR